MATLSASPVHPFEAPADLDIARARRPVELQAATDSPARHTFFLRNPYPIPLSLRCGIHFLMPHAIS